MNDLKDLLGARLFLLDMDGTLYLGDDVFPGAVDFIHTLADTGRQYIYPVSYTHLTLPTICSV